jgi:hypothetical protein
MMLSDCEFVDSVVLKGACLRLSALSSITSATALEFLDRFFVARYVCFTAMSLMK